MSRTCGYPAPSTGAPCTQLVGDLEDHCAAGHPCPPASGPSSTAGRQASSAAGVGETGELLKGSVREESTRPPHHLRRIALHFYSGSASAWEFRPTGRRLAPHLWEFESRARITTRMSTGRAANLMAQGRLTPTKWPPKERSEVVRVLAVRDDGSVAGGLEEEAGTRSGRGWAGPSAGTRSQRHMTRSEWVAPVEKVAGPAAAP